jgi:hypothetical protein
MRDQFTIEDINPNAMAITEPAPNRMDVIDLTPNAFTADEAAAWFEYFISLMDFLWAGNVFNEKLLSRVDQRFATITGKDFAGTMLPAGTAATFALPADADFIADDLDGCWFDALGMPKQKTFDQLIGTDWARTLVLFPNVSPLSISAIGLLKKDLAFTDEIRNRLAAGFLLWILWSEQEIKI